MSGNEQNDPMPEKITVMAKPNFVRLAYLSLTLFFLAGFILYALATDKPIAVEGRLLRGIAWFIVGTVPVAFLFTIICWIFERPKPVELHFPTKRDPKNIY